MTVLRTRARGACFVLVALAVIAAGVILASGNQVVDAAPTAYPSCFSGGNLTDITYTIPATGVSGLRLTVYGGRGEDFYSYPSKWAGGNGSFVQGDFALAPGTQIRIGTLPGGTGGTSVSPPVMGAGPGVFVTDPGGNGGEAQYAIITGACPELLSVAGGGGGAASSTFSDTGSDPGPGGNADDGTGARYGADGGDNDADDGAGGAPGTQTSGGAGGAHGHSTDFCHDGADGGSGGAASAGNGGNAADIIMSFGSEYSYLCRGGAGAGGGGAGYYGGGGGGSAYDDEDAGGGGGGSSYHSPRATNVVQGASSTEFGARQPGPAIIPITNTTTTISSSKSPASFGEPVTFTANVSRVTGGVARVGTVSFYDQTNGSVLLGTSNISNGVATLAVSTLSQGVHRLAAAYNGGSDGGEVNNPSYSPGVEENGVIVPPLRQVIDPPPPSPSAPDILSNPLDVSMSYGGTCSRQPGQNPVCGSPNFTFEASASGIPAPARKWQVSMNNGGTWTNIEGATGSSYSELADISKSGRKYRVIFTNSEGSVTSSAATLSVVPVPIKVVADDRSVAYGSSQLTLTANYIDLRWVLPYTPPAGGLPGTLLCLPTPNYTTTTAPGTYPINCSGLTEGNYAFTYQAGTLTVQTPVQAITFTSTAPTNAVVGGTYNVTAYGGGSGNAVTFSVDPTTTTSACTVTAAGLVTFNHYNINGGTAACVIAADQAGNGFYPAATTARQTVTVHGTGSTVTTNPSDRTVPPGTSVTFTAAATPTPLHTQWEVSTNNGQSYADVPGATSTTLTLTATAAVTGNIYRAYFYNDSASRLTTGGARLTVNGILQQPEDAFAAHFELAYLVAKASAASGAAPTVKWEYSGDGTNWVYYADGLTQVSGTVTTTQFGMLVYPESKTLLFRAKFTDSSGTYATRGARVVEYEGARVSSDPTDASVALGQTATFTAEAEGAPAPTVQWQLSTDDGDTYTDITGATVITSRGGFDPFDWTSTLTIPNVTQSMDGNKYRAIFSNVAGPEGTAATVATSAAATLTVPDGTAPVISGMPTNQTLVATSASGAVGTYTAPTALDAADGVLDVTCTPASGTTFPVGANEVSCSATDEADNTSTEKFTITVQARTTPAFTGTPSSVTIEATGPTGAAYTYTPPTAADNAGAETGFEHLGSIPGLHASALEFMHETDASILVWDLLDAGGPHDPSVDPFTQPVLTMAPVHAIAIPYMGMPLLDNADLEELAATCAQLGRAEFLLVVAPLPITRGTGSPVNPMAVF